MLPSLRCLVQAVDGAWAATPVGGVKAGSSRAVPRPGRRDVVPHSADLMEEKQRHLVCLDPSC
jgi:hypothetical protein